jgi:hypothetical protein
VQHTLLGFAETPLFIPALASPSSHALCFSVAHDLARPACLHLPSSCSLPASISADLLGLPHRHQSQPHFPHPTAEPPPHRGQRQAESFTQGPLFSCVVIMQTPAAPAAAAADEQPVSIISPIGTFLPGERLALWRAPLFPAFIQWVLCIRPRACSAGGGRLTPGAWSAKINLLNNRMSGADSQLHLSLRDRSLE